MSSERRGFFACTADRNPRPFAPRSKISRVVAASSVVVQLNSEKVMPLKVRSFLNAG